MLPPNREGSAVSNDKGWKLGNNYKDRQTDMWAPIEIDGSFDNEQMKIFWRAGFRGGMPDESKMAGMQKSATSFFLPLIEKLRDRGGDMVFIRMPGREDYEDNAEKAEYRSRVWEPMIETLDVVSIHSMDHPDLSSKLEIPEWSHLSRKSQDSWSSIIFDYVEPEYEKRRNKTIYEIMEVEAPSR